MAYANSLVYGVAVKKNAEIIYLTTQVDLAQQRVTEYQAIVDALQARSDQFSNLVSQATAGKAGALTNFKLARELLTSVSSLKSNYELAFGQADKASQGVALVSKSMAQLIGKLIFSVEIINKVGQLVNKQKAFNPSLPDSLVAFMVKANSDGNAAVALTLAALQSCYVAESSLLESSGAISRSFEQVKLLDKRLHSSWDARAQVPSASLAPADKDALPGLVALLHEAFLRADESYHQALSGSDRMTRQLAYAQTQLDVANMKLSSSQAGLKAATAAAYAA